MLPITSIKLRGILLPLITLSLAGCGLTQTVTDGTVAMTKSIFYKQIKILHLDFTTREALNTDDRENNSLSEPVLVRVYQLRERTVFDKSVYQQLVKDGETTLQADLLASRDLVVKPGGDATLDMPMEKDAKFVAVVALFRHPDMEKNSWKLVLDREELDPDKPRVIELNQQILRLLPVKE